MAFFSDLKVDLEDPVTLLISFKMGATQQGEYSYDQFKKGCSELGVDSFEAWLKLLPDLNKQL